MSNNSAVVGTAFATAFAALAFSSPASAGIPSPDMRYPHTAYYHPHHKTATRAVAKVAAPESAGDDAIAFNVRTAAMANGLALAKAPAIATDDDTDAMSDHASGKKEFGQLAIPSEHRKPIGMLLAGIGLMGVVAYRRMKAF